jgi:hypothetical protein
MKWTTNPPTVPGWYWFRENDAQRALVLDVQPLSNGKLAIMRELNRLGGEYMFVEELNGEWAGPLSEPK